MNFFTYLEAHTRMKIGQHEWIVDRPEELIWIAQMCGMAIQRIGWWEYTEIGGGNALGGGGPQDTHHPGMYWSELYWEQREFPPDEGSAEQAAYLQEIRERFPDRNLHPSFVFADWYVIPDFPSWSAGSWQQLLDALTVPGERVLFKREKPWRFLACGEDQQREHVRINRRYYRAMRADDPNYPFLADPFLRRTTEEILGCDSRKFGLNEEDFTAVGTVLDKIPEWAGFSLCYAIASAQAREQDRTADRIWMQCEFSLGGLWKNLWNALNGLNDWPDDPAYDRWYAFADPEMFRKKLDGLESGQLMITAAEDDAMHYSLYICAVDGQYGWFTAIHDRAGRITDAIREKFGMKLREEMPWN